MKTITLKECSKWDLIQAVADLVGDVLIVGEQQERLEQIVDLCVEHAKRKRNVKTNFSRKGLAHQEVGAGVPVSSL